MSRLIVAALCAVLAFPVLAEEEGSLADAVKPPASDAAQQAPADQGAAQPPADQGAAPADQGAAPADQGATPADVDMARVRAAEQAASGVPATGEAQGGGQTPSAEPKSSIPLDKRQGGDITQCLESGDKSDKAIAACADKYRPHGRTR
jgi:hypothetical protein